MESWIAWSFKDGKFHLIDWGSDAQSDAMSKKFWPCITLEQAQGTVLLECHKTGRRIERDIINQELPGIDVSDLPYRNGYIVAEKRYNEDYGDFIECTYYTVSAERQDD